MLKAASRKGDQLFSRSDAAVKAEVAIQRPMELTKRDGKFISEDRIFRLEFYS